MRRNVATVFALAAVCAAGWALGQDKAAPAEPKGHVMENESEIQWMDAPPVFPAGAKMAVLQGDPNKPGPFTVRLKVGDGYKVAPHWHPTAENLTIISGTFNVGTGDTADASKTTALTAGGFATMPAKMHHFAWAKGPTEVQIHSEGPFKLIYVNPKDDPTHTASK
jgi:hypothetical protein